VSPIACVGVFFPHEFCDSWCCFLVANSLEPGSSPSLSLSCTCFGCCWCFFFSLSCTFLCCWNSWCVIGVVVLWYSSCSSSKLLLVVGVPLRPGGPGPPPHPPLPCVLFSLSLSLTMYPPHSQAWCGFIGGIPVRYSAQVGAEVHTSRVRSVDPGGVSETANPLPQCGQFTGREPDRTLGESSSDVYPKADVGQ
jgi:hypothetical protein